MPQAIAMQLPVIAAATPAAAVALASDGSATGKAPLFAGLLMQFGRIASPPASSARTPAGAGQQATPQKLPATGQSNETPLTPPTAPMLATQSAGGQAVARKAGSPSNAKQQSADPEPLAMAQTDETPSPASAS